MTNISNPKVGPSIHVIKKILNILFMGKALLKKKKDEEEDNKRKILQASW